MEYLYQVEKKMKFGSRLSRGKKGRQDDLLRYVQWFPTEAQHLSEIQKITARNSKSTTQLLKIQEGCTNLKELDVSSCDIQSNDMEILKKMKDLEKLTILIHQIHKSECLQILLNNLNKLQSLQIKNKDINDTDVQMICSKLPHMQSFGLSACLITFQSLKSICSLAPHLKSLSLKGCKIGDKGCSYIAFNFPYLQFLQISQCGLDNQGLININNNLHNLKYLAHSIYNINANMYLRDLHYLQSLNQFSTQYLGENLIKRLALNLKSLRSISAKSLDFRWVSRRFRKNLKYISKIACLTD